MLKAAYAALHNSTVLYDLVTTWPYIPRDPMALTLDGSTQWPNRKKLIKLAQQRCALSTQDAEHYLEKIADTMSSIAPQVKAYFADKKYEIGEQILEAWETGIKESLGETKGLVQISKKNR